MTRSFACEYASEVTRRDGPDIGCHSEAKNKLCNACFSEIKNRALPEMGFSDDLTSMPASALQKIQYGSLIALQASVSGQTTGGSIDNIAALIETAYGKYQSLDSFPYEQCLDTIKNFKIKRRRGK